MERTSADLVQLLADDLSGVDEALTEALSEGVQGFRGSGVQGFRGSGVQGFRGSGGCRGRGRHAQSLGELGLRETELVSRQPQLVFQFL
jgi:hypothetical protein